MKTWIGSDYHWHHSNILKFCPETRGHFNTVEEMNARMIMEWNTIVSPDDTVYSLGDMAFCSAEKARILMKRLNGRIILVKGNHDDKNLKDPGYYNCFESVHDYLEVTYNGTHCVLFHYPIAEFNRQHKGSVHFHGHLHQNKSGLEHFRVRNVGMDYTGQILMRMENAIADALKGEIKGHH